MLVFIDESGDPGFKVDRGSTPIFAAAMVVFETREDAAAADECVMRALNDLNAHPEFKFNKSSHDRRDRFFQIMADCKFCVRAIIVKKDVIYSDRLRAEKDEFYRFFVKNMVKHDGGLLENAKVVIDGSGERIFRQDLQRHLKQHAKGIKLVKFADSRRDRLVQLADMCVGAIARSYRPDKSNHDRWRRMLRGKISDVWEFR